MTKGSAASVGVAPTGSLRATRKDGGAEAINRTLYDPANPHELRATIMSIVYSEAKSFGHMIIMSSSSTLIQLILVFG